MMKSFFEVMNHVVYGVPYWFVAAIVVALVERFLGRSKDARLRSCVAGLSVLLKWMLDSVRLTKVPVLGWGMTIVLETVSGSDIDGDGKVGKEKGK